jgi:hypothetical protein
MTLPACKRCRSPNLRVRWQTFADRTRHLRQECVTCGAFQRYLPQARFGEPASCYEQEADAAELAATAGP